MWKSRGCCLGTGRLYFTGVVSKTLFIIFIISFFETLFIIYLSLRTNSAFILQLWMNVIGGEASHGKEGRHTAGSLSQTIACSLREKCLWSLPRCPKCKNHEDILCVSLYILQILIWLNFAAGAKFIGKEFRGLKPELIRV